MKYLGPVSRRGSRAPDSSDWQRRFDTYTAHLVAIRHLLPEGAWVLATMNLHDAKLIRQMRPRKQEFEIVLNPTSLDTPAASDCVSLRFQGVSLVRPANRLPAVWLLEEVELVPDRGFSLEASLSDGRLLVIARDVVVTGPDWFIEESTRLAKKWTGPPPKPGGK